MGSGDDPRFEAIVREMGRMRSTWLRDGVPAADADDLVQECAIAAWEQLARGNLCLPLDEGPVEVGKVVRAFFRVVARCQRSRQLEKGEAFELSEEVPEQPVESAEDLFLARAHLRALEGETTPERWSALVALADGASPEEIARSQGVPRNTVYTRLRSGRLDLAAAARREAARRG